MVAKRFTRTKEDFICERCDASVRGNGYTNHCPVCLWSKHVDVNPGDRAALCGGLMEPVGIESKGGEYSIHHQCIRCGYIKPNKISPADDLDAALEFLRPK